MSRLYQHPGGHAIDFAANTLTVTDIDDQSVSIPIDSRLLLALRTETMLEVAQ